MDLTQGYALDEDGILVPPGLTRLTYQQNFVMGDPLPTSPAWLMEPKSDGTSASVGTGYSSVAHQAGAPGYLLINTGSTTDAVARLATTPIPMQQYAAIMIEFLGVQLSNANAATDDLNLVFSYGINSVSYTGGPSGNAGARVIQRQTDTHGRFLMPGVNGDHAPFGASYRTLREGYRFRNMGFLLYRSGQAVAFDDDPANPVGTLDAAGTMQVGSVCGSIMIQTKAAVNQSLRLGGVRLTLWREPQTL